MLLRRILAVILGIVLIAATWFALVVLRVHDTVLSSGFYVSQVRQADLFNFFYDRLLPLLIDEASDDPDLAREIDLQQVKPQIIAALRETFPPEWLQEQAEQAIEAFVPYVVGRRDDFIIQVSVAERMRAAGPAFKKAISDGAVVDLLYEDVVTPAVEEALADPKDIPFGLPLTAAEVIDVLRRIAPNDWLQGQLGAAIDAMLPYFAGDTDRFTVTIRVADRVEVARVELKRLLGKWDARAFLFEEIVDPTVDRAIGDAFRVPFGLTVTRRDVQAALREVFTEEWVRLRVNDLVDASVDYVSGRTRTFAMAVPLEDRKRLAVERVGALMDQRLAAAYQTARPCTAQELRAIDLAAFARTGIGCRPPDVSVEQLKAAAGLIDYRAEVARLVDAALPNTFVLTEAEVRAALGEEQWSLLGDVRSWVLEGFTFTTLDLEAELAKADYSGSPPYRDLDAAGRQRARDNSDNVKALRDIRRDVKDGAFTQEDLRQRLEEDDPDAYRELQDLREDLRAGGRSQQALAWLVPALLLVAVGTLGGLSIPAKVMWAASFLAVPSIILFLVAGPGYTQAARDTIKERVEDAIIEEKGQPSAVQATVNEKATEVALNGVDDFFSGLSQRALVLTVVSLVALGGGIGYYRWVRRRAPPERAP